MIDEFNNLGAYELMLILHELHELGYQKLRWLSYMAPNGCALRCLITIQDNIGANRDVMSLNKDVCWGRSVCNMSSGTDIKPFVSQFMKENYSLMEKGKGEDVEYVEWFNRLLDHAAKGATPVYYGEYFQLPLGFIDVNNKAYPGPPMRLRLISWNIDGIKAHFDSLRKLVAEYSPHIICLQKVKDSKNSPEFELPDYKRTCSPVAYGGVTTYVKECIPSETTAMDGHTFKGHYLKTTLMYPALSLYNVYVPYSNPSVDGAVEHRRHFDDRFNEIVRNTPDRMVICGDMNIVATSDDCWDGKYERNQANFHSWERENFRRLCKTGSLIDTYRSLHPREKEFSYFFRNDPTVRAKNQGHRIDYFLASNSLTPQITRAEIIKDYTVSTNNPILLEFRY